MKKIILFCIAFFVFVLPAAAQTTDAFRTSGSSADEVLIDGQLVRLNAPPVFKKKGFDKYCEWVMAHLQYPAEQKARKIEGIVRVKIIVETNGSVVVDQVLESPDEALTDAVKQVVAGSPKWTPGRMLDQASGQEVAVRVSYVMPVEFKIQDNPLGGGVTGQWQSNKNVRTYGSN